MQRFVYYRTKGILDKSDTTITEKKRIILLVRLAAGNMLENNRLVRAECANV